MAGQKRWARIGAVGLVTAVAVSAAPFAAAVANLAPAVALENVVYVATDGKPGAAGTLTDPVPSIAAARDLLAGQTSADSPGVVYVRGGEYPVSETTVLKGAEHSYVTYTAFPREKVVFTGARTLSTDDFQKVADVSGEQYSSASRLPDTVRDQVYVLDLKEAGIPTGEINKNGFNWVQQPLPPELLVDGASQTLAKYPNGDAKMTRSDLTVTYAPQGARDFFSDKTSQTKTYAEMLQMAGPILNANSTAVRERFLNWGPPTIWTQQVNQPPHSSDRSDPYYVDNSRHETDGWLSGYFGTDWATENVRIYSAANDGFNLRSKFPTMYRASSSSGVFSLVAQNILSELDSAGEYYIDRWTGNDLLYYLPADGSVAGKKISLTSINQPFFTLDGVTNVTFSKMSFAGGTGVGMQLFDCESCTIENTEFSNFSLDAIRIGEDNGELTALAEFRTRRGGHHNRVLNSSFHDLGGGGVFVAGGDRKSLARGDNVVSHNEFWNISKLTLATYTPAVTLAGVGNTASHNYIHDTPNMALQIFGNDMLVTHNRFENVLTAAADQAAVYSGRDYTYLGNEVSYNTFTGITGARRWAIYLDDGMSAMDIHHNFFESGTEAVYFNSGRAARLTDNVFLDHGRTGFELSFRTKHGATLPVPNQKVHVERFNDMLKPGDGTGFTNTHANVDTWLKHYAKDYPGLVNWYWPSLPDGTACQKIDTQTCTVAAAYENPNSLLVPADTVMSRNVRINTADWRFSQYGYDSYNPGINTIQVSASTPAEVGFDRNTRTFSGSSSLATTPHFGAAWITEWNSGFSDSTAGIPPLPDERFTVTAVAPARVTSGGPQVITLSGTSLYQRDTVRVTPKGGAPITATVKTVSADHTVLTAEVNLTSAPAGPATIEVRSQFANAQPVVLANALTITQPVLRATRAPAITGRPMVGQTLTASTGAWTPAATSYAYQWAANGIAIKGATRRTYLLPATAVGKRITVTVTASRTGATFGTATSARTAPVVKGAAPKATARPVIRGTVKVGAIVRATAGSWSPRPDAYRYEWRLNGKLIRGATSKLKITKSMTRKKLTVTVTAVKNGHVDGKAMSKAATVRK